MLSINDAEVSNRESVALGLDLRTAVVGGMVSNSLLRSEAKSLLWEVHIEHGAVSNDHNQRKAKVKEVEIAVHSSSAERGCGGLGWLEDGSGDEEAKIAIR